MESRDEIGSGRVERLRLQTEAAGVTAPGYRKGSGRGHCPRLQERKRFL